MTCAEVLAKISAFHDGELPPAERDPVAAHLAECPECCAARRDLARIGLLMLRHGRWQDKQIVPAEWVRRSTRSSQKLEPRCGLLWWVLRDPDGYAALGRLDTNVYVIPGGELVVVRTQARPRSGEDTGYHREALKLFNRMSAD